MSYTACVFSRNPLEVFQSLYGGKKALGSQDANFYQETSLWFEVVYLYMIFLILHLFSSDNQFLRVLVADSFQ
jgi:hypothetical protein